MYNRLFTKILDSSIWLEPSETRIVWLTLIAAMDEDGYAHFSAIENLAGRARVTLEQAQTAVDCFLNPDPNSSNPENEGRRVERVPGGFFILNAPEHRKILNREIQREQVRVRVARHRENVSGNKTTVTHSLPTVTHSLPNVTPVYVSEDVSSSDLGKGDERGKGSAPRELKSDFEAFWKEYPRKVAKLDALVAWKKPHPEITVILSALIRAKQTDAWKRDSGKFIPHPATWLNGARWEDEPPEQLEPVPIGYAMINGKIIRDSSHPHWKTHKTRDEEALDASLKANPQ